MVFTEYPDGRVTQSQVFTEAEELENSSWDLQKYNRYRDDCNALNTYLKHGMNVFLDRSVNPWTVVWT